MRVLVENMRTEFGIIENITFRNQGFRRSLLKENEIPQNQTYNSIFFSLYSLLYSHREGRFSHVLERARSSSKNRRSNHARCNL
ncbi:hypothetical protein LEP1GSC125_2928 [Leptospira mayottensis 200901122]|uniref:Uncharacterized protein n=1 Tax=Leptospira mayottensis 200901122 TaxID=1193010 RepID=A0AA87MMV4_9LEPT|nr:hypothetical protein LEP1GSC125_2928 [Leptospira mayottensis 200901122]